MSVEFGPAITGVGKRVPDRIVTNDELISSTLMDSSDEWIKKSTGIDQRHIAASNEATSDLVSSAACQALERADLEASKIDQIIVATVTPDMILPATACRVQDNLKAINAAAFDLSAACTGSLYGLAYATAMHYVGIQTSLVAGGETLSRITNPKDRKTAPLFADGAGAVVIQNVKNPGICEFKLRADGSKGKLLMMPAGGSRYPATRDTVEAELHYIQMENGQEVFKEAVNRMSEVAVEVLNQAGLTNAHGEIDTREIDLVIPHQANQRIIAAVGRRLNISDKKMYSNIARYGNTSAASIFIAMNDAYEEGRLHPGDKLLLVAFGAGLTYAAGVIQWHMNPPEIPFREKIARIIHHET